MPINPLQNSNTDAIMAMPSPLLKISDATEEGNDGYGDLKEALEVIIYTFTIISNPSLKVYCVEMGRIKNRIIQFINIACETSNWERNRILLVIEEMGKSYLTDEVAAHIPIVEALGEIHPRSWQYYYYSIHSVLCPLLSCYFMNIVSIRMNLLLPLSEISYF